MVAKNEEEVTGTIKPSTAYELAGKSTLGALFMAGDSRPETQQFLADTMRILAEETARLVRR